MTTAQSVAKLAPGKTGLHLPMAVIAFLAQAAGEATSVLEMDGNEALDALADLGWDRADDSFGKKAYRFFQLEDDTELRLTVVLRAKDGALKVDLRSWYDPTATKQ